MNALYDYVIIGGGISGLYCVDKLFEKYGNEKSILLLDERSYHGGRLLTNKRPKFELGAARFNDNHVLLKKLLKKYNKSYTKLGTQIDFIHDEHDRITYFNHAEEPFKNYMMKIIKKSKSFSESYLKSVSLKDFIDKITGSSELSSKLIHIFGYDSEITQMNAFDSLESMENDFMASNFYVLNQGFSSLCESISDALNKNKNIEMYKNSRVIDVKLLQDKTSASMYNIKYIHLTKDIKLNINSRNIIFAIKSKQITNFPLLKSIHRYTACIYDAPLLRVYAKYPKQKSHNDKVWFHTLNRTTTNNMLRQIIPIDKESGLIMISYTDGHDTKPFCDLKNGKLILKSDEELKKIISTQLDQLFPHCKISKPTYFKAYLWNIGAHHWKPGCDSEQIIQKARKPMNGVYVIGEAFSRKQAWVEGALDSVEDIITDL